VLARDRSGDPLPDAGPLDSIRKTKMLLWRGGRGLLGAGSRRWGRALSTEAAAPETLPPPPPLSRGPLGWGSVGALLVLGGAAVSYYRWLRERRIKALQTKSLGRPALGGPFSLVTHQGRPVTDADYRGMYLLVYFGFTYCPDVCPAELTKLGNAMEELKVARLDDAVVPLLVTLDGRRDTVAQLARYVREFHPRLIGLTGTPAQLQEVAKSYRVYSETYKTEEELEKLDDYLVDHTIFTYFMGPDGLIRRYFGKNMTSQEMATGMREAIDEVSTKRVDSDLLMSVAQDLELEKGPSFWSLLTGKT
jgi:protein SCO1/2